MRHYATNQKGAGSVPNAIEFFCLPNPSSRPMALESTQPLTSSRNIQRDKGRPALIQPHR
jgi:hypothetical protein